VVGGGRERPKGQDENLGGIPPRKGAVVLGHVDSQDNRVNLNLAPANLLGENPKSLRTRKTKCNNFEVQTGKRRVNWEKGRPERRGFLGNQRGYPQGGDPYGCVVNEGRTENEN